MLQLQLKDEQEISIDGPEGPLQARIAGFGRNDAVSIEAKSDKNELARGIGIVCHPHPQHQGSMDNKVVTTVVKAYRALGLASIRFNFRGVGKSAGSYGEGKGEIEDLKAVLAWALKQVPSAAIWLAGFSFGTYVATAVAAENAAKASNPATGTSTNDFSIKALLTIAPPVHHFEFDKLFEQFPLPECPWIIIQGDADEVVPFDRVLEFYENTKKRKNDMEMIVMHQASHFFHGRLVELQHDIETALRKLE